MNINGNFHRKGGKAKGFKWEDKLVRLKIASVNLLRLEINKALIKASSFIIQVHENFCQTRYSSLADSLCKFLQVVVSLSFLVQLLKLNFSFGVLNNSTNAGARLFDTEFVGLPLC